MTTKIEYVPINESHIDEAVNMVASAYDREREAVPCLPEDDFNECFRALVENLFTWGSGIAAIQENKLVGFLAGFVVDEFFGSCSGIYCPLYGHGAVGEHRIEIYRNLYERAAQLWVKDSHLTHVVTMFAHDGDLVNAWFWQGFGLRCVDAIRETAAITVKESPIRIKKSVLEDAVKLADIHTRHNIYYRKSPMFMPRGDEDAVQEQHEHLSKENHHEWVAYRDDTPVGIIRLGPTAESFVADHPSVMNVNVAYVAESERGNGIGAMLLAAAQDWLLQNGYPLCGVDFESFNPSGSSFWMKYFTPYTYSLVRRIDERILGYMG